MITKELQATLSHAVNEAIKRRHEHLTLEHLLYAILRDPVGSKVILHCAGDIDALRQQLEEFMSENIEQLPEGGEQMPEQTPTFERVLERAALQAQASGQQEINAGNILAALFQERQSHAVYLLEKQGISRLDVLNYISHDISKIPQAPAPDAKPATDDEDGAHAARDPLVAFTVNLIAKAAEGQIDPLIGRRPA